MEESVGCFDFPPNFDIHSLARAEDLESDACVVSVFGKTRFSNSITKASILNDIIGKNVFKGPHLLDGDHNEKIECFYDSTNHVIFLHHASIFDSINFAQLSLNTHDDEDLVERLEREELSYAKTLLYLFSISHIVLLCTAGPTLDLYYLKLFRVLENMRNKTLPRVSEILMDFDLPKDWVLSGRPCSPRVLFLFDSVGVDARLSDKGDKCARTQLRRHQHTIEDTIYKLLRKNRIVTNISNNSLFAIPPNQEFVFVKGDLCNVDEPLSLCLELLRDHCQLVKPIDSSENKKNSVHIKGDNEVLKEFLMEHVDLALGKGFDDNSGKKHVPPVFERTSCLQTFMSISELYYAFFGHPQMDMPVDATLESHFVNMASLINTRRKFSDHRCSKVLPMAETAYQEGLPTHYTNKYHQSKLAQARQVLAQLARGPAYTTYLCQLEDSCDAWWRNGRQLCEKFSLTLNHCTNPLHRRSDELETPDNKHLPVMPHCSQITVSSVCDCGRMLDDRDDPFTHKMANYDFYRTLGDTCCHELRRMDMAVFTPSTPDSRPAVKPPSVAASVTAYSDDAEKTKEVAVDMSSMSQGVNLSQSSLQDKFPSDLPTESHSPPTLDLPTNLDSSLDRQASTIEYLPGMIHSESPPGLLPQFPSWSLCSIGKSSTYNPTVGIDQLGFMHGSNFLLPWDIVVKADKEKWPTVGETSKKGKQRKIPVKEPQDITLRAYIGLEYECPRGHRFFCSGPDKVIKVASTASLKVDNANKLRLVDMPLYSQCLCRSTKTLSKLMRAFVACPDGPLTITLKPQVQPAPSPCPLFHPGFTAPIPLPAGEIWVLRLPYMYLGESGAYLPPSDNHGLSQCYLMHGMFSYHASSQST